MKTTAFAVFVLLLLAAAMHFYYYYPKLPETIASHFGAGGAADGWASKGSFAAVYLGTLLLTAGMFFVIVLLVPRLPASMVNLPNKDVWLAPEHRDATMASLTSSLLWMGNATVLFLIVVGQLVFEANQGGEPRLDASFLVALVLYLVVMIAAAIGLVTRFSKKP